MLPLRVSSFALPAAAHDRRPNRATDLASSTSETYLAFEARPVERYSAAASSVVNASRFFSNHTCETLRSSTSNAVATAPSGSITVKTRPLSAAPA